MSNFLQKKNNAESHIADVGGISAVATSFNVTTGEGSKFPSTNFKLTIENEIMLVGTRTGDTLSSITRGDESTTAVVHSQNAVVEHRFTQGTFVEYEDVFDKTKTSSKAEDILLATQSVAPTTPASGYMKLYPKTDGKWYYISNAGVETEFTAGLTASNLYLNLLMNGNFDIWQRNSTFTTPNDDTYGPDRWNFLLDGNGAWTFSRSTDIPTGDSNFSLKAVNVTLNKQCGIVQFLEAGDAKKLQNKLASIAFYAKTTTAKEISNLRVTILSWTGTADAVTSDVVGTWAGAGTDPTWAASYTAEVAGSNKALTTAWQRFTIENISIDTAGITNLAVVIWVDDTTIAANDEFYITQIQVNQGATAQTYQPRAFGQELFACQRFYEKSYDYATVPGTSTNNGTVDVQGVTTSATTGFQYKTRKRTTSPTITFYTTGGTAGKIAELDAGTEINAALSASLSGEMGIAKIADANTALTAARWYKVHYVIDAEL